MFKELIEDITFDRITLSQALTRAKIIAFKINNSSFKEWINSEINGYKQTQELPDYRVTLCDIHAEIQSPFHGKRLIPVDVSNLNLDDKLYKMRVIQSIATLEDSLKNSGNHHFGYENLPMGIVNLLKNMIPEGDYISAIMRRVQFSQMRHIVDTTKQKLLDTLLELNEAFPNLENEYSNNAKNTEKTQTIITQNIYGNNTNSNIGVGEYVEQSIVGDNKIEKFITEIEKMGIGINEVEEVRTLLADQTDKPNLGKKLMAWVGKVATKAIEKGIDLQIPTLISKVHELI